MIRVLALGAVVLVATACLGLGVVAGALAGTGTGAAAGPSGTSSGLDAAGAATGAATLAAIPPAMLALYRQAADACPGLPWEVVAAVGTVESANGTSTAPGVTSGSNAAGAEGPMQFEPATFSAYAEPVPPGGADPPSPYDPVDAVAAAGRMLCADGAAGGVDLAGALFAYNHDQGYVQQVLALAGDLEAAVGAAAAGWAWSQLGVPYRWGGTDPAGGFDCSGLVQAAYAQVGVTLPRVAAAQQTAGPALPAETPLQAGDLVFFGSPGKAADHVGIVVGAGTMVDAPHPGSVVRVDGFTATPGASWGDEAYLGATRPAAQ